MTISAAAVDATGITETRSVAVDALHKAKPAFGVLGALSASHMLNDMMQSLLLAMYPMLKGEFALSFAQIGLITLTYQLTASLLQPLVGLYTDRRPQPLFAAVRHGVHAVRPAAAGLRAELRDRAAGRGVGRHRLVGLSSRVVAHRAPGFGRAAWLRAIAVSGRRQHRHAPSGRCWRRGDRAVRPAQRGLVRRWRAGAGIVLLAAGEPLVCGAARRRPSRRKRRGRSRAVSAPASWSARSRCCSC